MQSKIDIESLQDVIDRFREFSHGTAVVYFQKDKKRNMPYKELRTKVRRLSGGLIANGLKKGDVVLLAAANSPEALVAVLSVIYAGGVCAPIDAQLRDEVLNHIIEDCQARFAFVDSAALERWKRLDNSESVKTICLQGGDGFESLTDWLAREQDPSQKCTADDTAVIFYTSGTSGMPKGVPLSHANLIFQIEAVTQTGIIKDTDSALLPLPLFHVYPFAIGLSVLALGRPIILPSSITGPEIMRSIREGEATIVVAVPRLLRALYSAIEQKFRAHKLSSLAFDAAINISNLIYACSRLNPGKILFAPVHKRFPKLRLLACGGAPLDPKLARALRAIGWQSAVGYGLTETSPLLTIRMPDNTDLESVGKAISGVEIRLREVEPDADEERSEEDERDTEIQAKGPGIFSGYLNLTEKTEESFTDDGWFRTGDIGSFKAGNLHITGRISSTLKSEGGKKIQPDDLEEVYAKAPSIKEIGILASNNKLAALVVPDLKAIGHDDLNKTIERELHDRSQDLPSYDRINDFAITREPLPRTRLGKVRRKELHDRYEKASGEKKGKSQQAGESAEPALSEEDSALLEEPIVRQCWDWLLQRFPDAQLDFNTSPQLDLNVDSLEWVNLTIEMRERLGVDLNEEAISRIDTTRDLLQEVLDASRSGQEVASPFEKPEALLDEEQKKWLKPLGPIMSFIALLVYHLNRLLMRALFHIEARGREQLPDQQFVLIPNHASYLDAFALAAVLDFETLQQTHWAGWAGIAFANPFNTFIYRLAQVVPIDAKGSLMSSLAFCVSVLKNGKNLIWFPEGERTLTGELLPFKPGIGMLLEKFSLPVSPVYIEGTREALPPGSYFPRFKKVRVIFGKPVASEQLAAGQKDNEHAPQKIAQKLQGLVQELKDAKSPVSTKA